MIRHQKTDCVRGVADARMRTHHRASTSCNGGGGGREQLHFHLIFFSIFYSFSFYFVTAPYALALRMAFVRPVNRIIIKLQDSNNSLFVFEIIP